jgi:hypothetical protein
VDEEYHFHSKLYPFSGSFYAPSNWYNPRMLTLQDTMHCATEILEIAKQSRPYDNARDSDKGTIVEWYTQPLNNPKKEKLCNRKGVVVIISPDKPQRKETKKNCFSQPKKKKTAPTKPTKNQP